MKKEKKLTQEADELLEKSESYIKTFDIIEGSKEGLCATYLTYTRNFGSIKEAREAAGIIQ